jgi:hypothetical protein
MIERTPDIPAYFDSMSACVSDLGIPLGVLKRAKATGSDAFRSNRVDVRKLIVFLATRGAELPDVDLDTANTYVALERAAILKIEKEEKLKSLYSAETVDAMDAATHGPIRTAFLSLVGECAVKCNQIDPDVPRKVLGDWVKSKMRDLQGELEDEIRKVNNGAIESAASGAEDQEHSQVV